MVKTNKTQVAIEFLLITGFFLLIVVPTILYFYQYTQEAATDVEVAKANSIGNAIVDTAENVYYYGRFSKLTLDVQLPQGVKAINITEDYDNEVYGLNIYQLGSELFFESKIPIRGNFSGRDLIGGKHEIVLETKKDTSMNKNYVDIKFYYEEDEE